MLIGEKDKLNYEVVMLLASYGADPNYITPEGKCYTILPRQQY